MAEFEDSDSVEEPPMVTAMVEKAKRYGPCVLEYRTCCKCGHEFWVYHNFQETIGCGHCRHPHGSIVKKYLSVMEHLVDDK